MILVFVHVTEDLLHRRVANGPVEVDQFYSRGWNRSQQRQQQQQPAEAGWTVRLLSTRVMSEH